MHTKEPVSGKLQTKRQRQGSVTPPSSSTKSYYYAHVVTFFEDDILPFFYNFLIFFDLVESGGGNKRCLSTSVLISGERSPLFPALPRGAVAGQAHRSA
jgi:hypothetical protein